MRLMTDDLRNSIVRINATAYETEEYGVLYEYFTYFYRYFDKFQEYQRFFVEVGRNHPQGVNAFYLENLIASYTQSLWINKMITKGFIEEVYDEEGNVNYKYKEQNYLK